MVYSKIKAALCLAFKGEGQRLTLRFFFFLIGEKVFISVSGLSPLTEKQTLSNLTSISVYLSIQR